jgi:hypothetical protein
MSHSGIRSSDFRSFLSQTSIEGLGDDLKKVLLSRMQIDGEHVLAQKRLYPAAAVVRIYWVARSPQPWPPDVFPYHLELGAKRDPFARLKRREFTKLLVARQGEIRVTALGLTADLCGECCLFDLRAIGRVDVARVGRGDRSYFRERGFPFHNDIEVGALSPVGPEEAGAVSREHGLVVLDGAKVFFVDFGSVQHLGLERFSGSKNGTFVSGLGGIRDVAIEWSPGQALGLPGLGRGQYMITLEQFREGHE